MRKNTHIDTRSTPYERTPIVTYQCFAHYQQTRTSISENERFASCEDKVCIIDFRKVFNIYFNSLSLVPIGRKATLFIAIWMIEVSKGIRNEDLLAYATAHRIAHELLFN